MVFAAHLAAATVRMNGTLQMTLEERRKKIQEDISEAMHKLSIIQERIYNLARERDIIDGELRKPRDGGSDD